MGKKYTTARMPYIHMLHGLIRPLARTVIETYVAVDGGAFDPFCGGGGVLVESILSGRSVAVFALPMAILIILASR